MSFLRRRRASVAAPEPASTRAEIARGWNDLPWGTSIAEFEARFAGASGEAGGWWRTGTGPEEFCGIVMDARYAFNSRGELYLVALYPGTRDRERLAVAVLNELGAPDGTSTRWTIGEVEADVKIAGTVATLTHRRLATE
jgi:hypothetical protein